MQRLINLFHPNFYAEEDPKTSPDKKNEEIKEEIGVIGAGPVGLAFIACLMRDIKEQGQFSKKYKITLIEKRTDFDRAQKLIVNESDIVGGVEKGIGWKNFCLQLFDPNNIYFVANGKLQRRDGVQITTLNKRERFIRKLLREKSDLRKDVTFSIKSLQNALFEYINDPANKPPNLEFNTEDIHFGTSVTAVQSDKNSKNKKLNLSVKNPDGKQKSIECNTLFLSEGEARQVTGLVNDAAAEMKVRSFTYNNFSHKKQPGCVVRLKIKSLDKIDGKFDSYATLFDVYSEFSYDENSFRKKLKEFGWTKSELPDYAVNTNFRTDIEGKKPVFGISAELPDQIYNMPDSSESDKKSKQNALIKWALLLAAFHHDLPVEFFEFDEKGGDNSVTQRISTFNPDRKYVDRPVMELNGNHVVMAGDCAMSSFHDGGKSAMKGMNIAMTTSQCIVKKPFEISSMQRFAQVQSKYNLFKNEQAYHLFNSSLGAEPPFDLSPSLHVGTPNLVDAVDHYDMTMVQTLLNKGENPNILIGSATPLSIAIEKGYLDIADVLLKNGANPNLNPNLFIIALKNKDRKAIDLLFSYGATPVYSEQQNQIASLAIKMNDLGLITQLLLHGLKPSYFEELSPAPFLLNHIKNVVELKKQIWMNIELIYHFRINAPVTYSLGREQTLNYLYKIINNIMNHQIYANVKSEEGAFPQVTFTQVKDIENRLECLAMLDELSESISKNGIHEFMNDSLNLAYKKLSDVHYDIVTIFKDILEDIYQIEKRLTQMVDSQHKGLFKPALENSFENLESILNLITLLEETIQEISVNQKQTINQHNRS